MTSGAPPCNAHVTLSFLHAGIWTQSKEAWMYTDDMWDLTSMAYLFFTPTLQCLWNWGLENQNWRTSPGQLPQLLESVDPRPHCLQDQREAELQQEQPTLTALATMGTCTETHSINRYLPQGSKVWKQGISPQRAPTSLECQSAERT